MNLTPKRIGTPSYNPVALLDAVIADMSLKNDAALSRATKLAAPVISKIRAGKIEVSDGVLLRLHDTSGISVGTLRSLMGAAQVEAYEATA